MPKTTFQNIFENTWMHLVTLSALLPVVGIRMLTLYGASNPWGLFLWIVLDVSFALITFFSIAFDHPIKEFLYFLYLNVYTVISIPTYQYLYGSGGRITFVSILYIWIGSVGPIEKKTRLQPLSWGLILASTGFTLHYIAEFDLSDLLTSLWFCIAVIMMFSYSILKMQNLIDVTLEMDRQHVQEVTKQKLLSVASHELRNPLHALSFLTTYLNSFEFTAIQQEIINDIMKTLDILNSIIESVLDYAKIDQNQMVLIPKKFSVLDVVERVAIIFYYKGKEKGVGVFTRIDPSLPLELIGDSTKLTQILSNLAGNAVKYTNSGHVIISAAKKHITKDRVSILFSVEDTGPGMTKEDLANIYQPFERAKDATMGDQQGWGLGLMIIRQLVTLMNGEIDIESVYQKYTRVHVTLPFEIQTKILIKDIVRTIPHVETMAIDIVHSNLAQVDILRFYLDQMGFRHIDDHEYSSSNKMDGITQRILIIHEKFLASHDWEFERYDKVVCIGSAKFLEEFKKKSAKYNNLDVIIEPICFLKLNSSLSDFSSKKSLASEAKPLKLTNNTGGIMETVPTPLHYNEDVHLKNITVLIVEDNVIIHQIEKKTLEQHGAKVYSAFNGQESLDIVESLPPFDCILMDVKMPVMDGIEAMNRIRGMPDPKKSSIPIIIVTGNTIQEMKESNCEGASEILSKPVNPKVLMCTIQRVLQDKR